MSSSFAKATEDESSFAKATEDESSFAKATEDEPDAGPFFPGLMIFD